MWRSFLTNRKANVGFGMFVVLLVMAVFPSLFTSVSDPTAPARFMPRLTAVRRALVRHHLAGPGHLGAVRLRRPASP